MFALLILLSQKQDPSRNESYNLIKRCKCVKYFWWIVDELHWMIYLSLCIIFLGHGLYIFFSSLSFYSTCLVDMWHTFFGYASLLLLLYFFWHAFWACGIPSLGMHLLFLLLLFFFIAHILDSHFREKESWYVMEFYFVGGWQCLLCEWTCTRSWSWEYDKSLTRVKKFDKTQSKVKLHMRVWSWKSNFGLGGNL